MGWKATTLALAMLVAGWAALSTGGCDTGDGPGTECTPGEDPEPGCGLEDCRQGKNDCAGLVYACDSSGMVIELGTCDTRPHDAGPGDSCIPGTEPVPGCTFADCNMGRNDCGGVIFSCDMSGQVVASGSCQINFPVDAAVAPPDAAPMPG